MAKIVMDTLSSLITSDNFEVFWKNILQVKELHDIDDSKLPRKRRQPQKHHDATASAGHYT